MIFKNINSEDISGLIICSEPPISSSAIRTKETTIDGRDGAIVEKLGYKTRIRNVEIGLKKDANVDKILSYFSGEGDLIFKNENDKVYKAAIYEQVDLERLLRLRKGSVAFYCQPFKYKRNDIFETIKDNKVKEKKGKHLELLNCAEQNVVDLKLEGSTSQVTRSGKNLLDISKYVDTSLWEKTTNYFMFTPILNEDIPKFKNVLSGRMVLKGTAQNLVFGLTSEKTNPTKELRILNNGTLQNTSYDFKNADNIYLVIGNGNMISSDKSEIGLIFNNYNIQIEQGTTATEYEQYGVSPSPDYLSEIENVEGKNKFNKSNMTEATWDNGKTNTVTLLEDGRIQSTANYAQWAAKCIDIPNLKANTNYVVSGKIVSSTAGNAMITVKGYKNNTLSNIIYRQYAVGTKFELSFNSSDYEKIGISLNGNNSTLETIYTTIFDEIQLEESTVATSYIPYNSLEIKDVGENLFNPNNVSKGYVSDASGNILSISGQNKNTGYIEIIGGEKYYILSNKPTGNWGAWYDKDKKFISGIALGDNSSGIITAPSNAYFMAFTLSYNNNNPDYANNVIIARSDKATPYTPYQEQKVVFPLSDGQKLMKGSYLADDGIHNKRKQYVITGNETIEKIWIDDDTHHVFAIKASLPVPQISDKTYKEYLCNTYRVLSYDGKIDSIWANRKDNNTNYTTAMAIDCFNSSLSMHGRIIIKDMSIDDIDKMKTYLSEQYSNGTPVIVEYELASEEIVPYTTEQQEAYNQLQKLKLYKGQNTMFSLEGSIINLKYLEDTDEKVENQGNIYSKPIIRLEKTVFKEVEIAINGIRFKYNFEEDDYVEIDCEEMTVQYEGLDRNRRLVIDFEFPKLKEGNNDIVMYSGDCIIKCKRKDRWL